MNGAIEQRQLPAIQFTDMKIPSASVGSFNNKGQR